MNRGLRRGALISFLLHAAILAALIITLPPLTIPEAADDSVSVDVQGLGVPQQALNSGKVPSPTNTPTVNHNTIARDKTKPLPYVPPPPPPPPPPPSQDQTVIPKPPQIAPPLPPPVVTPTPAHTPPPVPHPPQKTQSTAQAKVPAPAKHPAAPPKSVTHQPNPVKTPVPLSQSVLNALSALENNQQQTKAPTAHYNEQQSGAVNGGGATQATANSGLTGADRDAIGNHVRPCFDVDAGAPGLSTFSVELLVQTGPDGTVHNAVVAPQDQAKLSDPIFNAYAQRAIDAVMNYQCATLPLPPSMLGQDQTLLFNFTPGD